MITEYAACNKTDLEIKTFNIAPKKRSTEGRTLFDRIVISGFEMLKKNRKLKKELKYNKPDIIHMTTSGQLAVLRDIMFIKTAKKFNVPITYHLHFGKTSQIAEKKGLFWKLYLNALKNADIVIAIDKKTYDTLNKYIPNAKVKLIPNPINISSLPVYNDALKKTVMFLGWVIPTKGVMELVKAWNEVTVEFPEYKLLIVGQYKQSYYEQILKTVKCESIQFTGEKSHDDAMSIMAQCSLFVLPSYTEGFPTVILEAMALRKAIVATRVGAIPEMLAGNCGIVIEPHDVHSLAYALRKLLSDSKMRDEFANNSSKKVRCKYNISIVLDIYKDVWAEAIKRKVKGATK